MTSFSGCDNPCMNNSTLSYTGNQIGSFQQEWQRLNYPINHSFTGGNVWATDYIEDLDFNGFDYQNTDDGDFFVYSGHGGNPNNPWGETFIVPTCHSNSSSYSCNMDIEDARFDEYFSKYTSPHPGFLRWALFMTCDSVDTAPDQQWGQTMWFGMDYVMGFRGTSADSPLTTGDAGNMVDDSFGINHSYSFKSSWLDHGDADWITGGDTPEVMAPGVGLDDATSRRDNEYPGSWTRDDAQNTTTANAFAWSWAD
jgi:hypothetical protein